MKTWVNSVEYPNTNVINLVNDVLRNRKTFVPNGWKIFCKALGKLNVPQDLIGNKLRWNYMQKELQGVPTDSENVPKSVQNKDETGSGFNLGWLSF